MEFDIILMVINTKDYIKKEKSKEKGFIIIRVEDIRIFSIQGISGKEGTDFQNRII
jgi:hypothetical protein